VHRIGAARFGGVFALAVIGVGLLLIALAWNGAAGTLATAEQNAYLISGGLGGVALVIAGAALLLSQVVREERGRLESKLDELIDVVARVGMQAGATPADVAGLVVAGPSSYHRRDCRLAEGRDLPYVTPAEAAGRGLTPCRVCQPERADNSGVIVR
jgi:hypothetical protein